MLKGLMGEATRATGEAPAVGQGLLKGGAAMDSDGFEEDWGEAKNTTGAVPAAAPVAAMTLRTNHTAGTTIADATKQELEGNATTAIAGSEEGQAVDEEAVEVTSATLCPNVVICVVYLYGAASSLTCLPDFRS